MSPIKLSSFLPEAESEASQEAKRLGLDYMSFGRYGKDGKVTHKSDNGKLVPVKPGEEHTGGDGDTRPISHAPVGKGQNIAVRGADEPEGGVTGKAVAQPKAGEPYNAPDNRSPSIAPKTSAPSPESVTDDIFSKPNEKLAAFMGWNEPYHIGMEMQPTDPRERWGEIEYIDPYANVAHLVGDDGEQSVRRLGPKLNPAKEKAFDKVIGDRVAKGAEDAHYDARAKDAAGEDEYDRLTQQGAEPELDEPAFDIPHTKPYGFYKNAEKPDPDLEYDPEYEQGKSDFYDEPYRDDDGEDHPEFSRHESVRHTSKKALQRESLDTSEAGVRSQRRARFNELKKAIDEMIDDEIDEISTSAAAGPYMTPNAFAGKQKTRRKQIAQQLGYKLTPGWEKNEGEPGKLSEGRYLEFKNSPGKPIQKIGKSIREMNHRLHEIEHTLSMVGRLKNESGIKSDHLKTRTHKALTAMEARLLSVAKRIREMKA